jgi:hypothetical protein
MKWLVRSPAHGGFYAGNGTWTVRPKAAFSFADAAKATAFCVQNQIHDYEIHVRSGLGPQHDRIIKNQNGAQITIMGRNGEA